MCKNALTSISMVRLFEIYGANTYHFSNELHLSIILAKRDCTKSKNEFSNESFHSPETSTTYLNRKFEGPNVWILNKGTIRCTHYLI